jgi:hypothetical protein
MRTNHAFPTELDLKTRLFVASLLLAPALVAAQDGPPPAMVEVELARSRACVPALAALEDLDRELEPLTLRAMRIQALGRAISLEDLAAVAPFDTTDAIEVAVREWFAEDARAGEQWAIAPDSTLLERRSEASERMRGRLRDEMEALAAEGQARIEGAGDLQEAVRPCAGAMFVRSAVLEVCDSVTSELCRAAADTAAGPFRFVDAPADIWDMEELRPWTAPGPARILDGGTLGGARTMVRARRGNIQVAVAVSPLIRERADITPEQAAEFDANLDSLGFSFDHPRFVMAPALEIQLDVAGPIGGETDYMVHFGDLSDPANQVLWRASAVGGGPVQAAFPAGSATLALLQQGESLRVTAVAMGEDNGEGAQGDAVYSIPLTNVNQVRAVTALLNYMATGQLSQDLAQLVPPRPGGA